ncbi:hypothetical protein [Streptomyces aurantiacus]|uniref:hypothetical protein n=1 Tax=Streptomyces aurantiacus TaxID=47760 RepID=UPI001BD3AE94|nr:hypothetical protein [Streptomyces aurantiacus]
MPTSLSTAPPTLSIASTAWCGLRFDAAERPSSGETPERFGVALDAFFPLDALPLPPPFDPPPPPLPPPPLPPPPRAAAGAALEPESSPPPDSAVLSALLSGCGAGSFCSSVREPELPAGERGLPPSDEGRPAVESDDGVASVSAELSASVAVVPPPDAEPSEVPLPPWSWGPFDSCGPGDTSAFAESAGDAEADVSERACAESLEPPDALSPGPPAVGVPFSSLAACSAVLPPVSFERSLASCTVTSAATGPAFGSSPCLGSLEATPGAGFGSDFSSGSSSLSVRRPCSAASSSAPGTGGESSVPGSSLSAADQGRQGPCGT